MVWRRASFLSAGLHSSDVLHRERGGRPLHAGAAGAYAAVAAAHRAACVRTGGGQTLHDGRDHRYSQRVQPCLCSINEACFLFFFWSFSFLGAFTPRRAEKNRKPISKQWSPFLIHSYLTIFFVYLLLLLWRYRLFVDQLHLCLASTPLPLFFWLKGPPQATDTQTLLVRHA